MRQPAEPFREQPTPATAGAVELRGAAALANDGKSVLALVAAMLDAACVGLTAPALEPLYTVIHPPGSEHRKLLDEAATIGLTAMNETLRLAGASAGQPQVAHGVPVAHGIPVVEGIRMPESALFDDALDGSL